jgi:tRNA(Ile)-lysidine synthetase-like protein
VIVVAVSGGPDSLCLLHLLAAQRERFDYHLHIAHLDHMLRGAESAADAQFVGEIAATWGLPATIESADVDAEARTRRLNRSHAARLVRYRFLARVAAKTGAQAVAVAHTASDQAETVLLHLVRGAGPAGLRGMRPVVGWHEWTSEVSEPAVETDGRRPALIRPLLAVPRVEVERYCAAHAFAPRHDPTNQNRGYTRSWVRYDLLPLLAAHNPQVTDALGRTAQICADEHDLVQRVLDDAWPQLARPREGAVELDGAAWHSLHPALRREAVRRAYRQLGHRTTLTWERVEQTLHLASVPPGGWIELPGGVVVTVGYGGMLTIGAPPELHGPQISSDQVSVPLPGRLVLEHGWSVETSYGASPEGPTGSRWEIQLDADTLDGPLRFRHRRPGDRLHPAGGTGHRSLQDLFVDAKVPRALRAMWPVLVSGETLIWVPGLRPAQGYTAGPDTQRTIRIQFVPPHVCKHSR